MWFSELVVDRRAVCARAGKPPDTMHPTLNIAIKAARRAATVISRAALDVDLLRVEAKQPNDFVTEVDRAAEEAIIQVLREAYPSHSILAEESGETGPEADTAVRISFFIGLITISFSVVILVSPLSV